MIAEKYRWYIAATLAVSFLFLIYFLNWCLDHYSLCIIEFSNGILILWFINITILYIIGFYFYASDANTKEKISGILLIGYSVYFVFYSIYTFSVGMAVPAGNSNLNNGSTVAMNIISLLLLIFTPYLYIYLLFLKKPCDSRNKPLIYGLFIVIFMWFMLFIIWLIV